MPPHVDLWWLEFDMVCVLGGGGIKAALDHCFGESRRGHTPPPPHKDTTHQCNTQSMRISDATSQWPLQVARSSGCPLQREYGRAEESGPHPLELHLLDASLSCLSLLLVRLRQAGTLTLQHIHPH